MLTKNKHLLTGIVIFFSSIILTVQANNNSQISPYDTLFIKASASFYNHQKFVEPARLEIIEIGEDILPFLITKIKSHQPREYHALRNLFKRIDGKISSKYLMEDISKLDKETFSKSVEYLGMSKYEGGVSFLKQFLLLKDSNWVVKSTIKGLGNLQDSTSIDLIKEYIDDEDETIRWYAVSALGKTKSKQAMEILLPILERKDDFQIVTHTAFRYLFLYAKDYKSIFKKYIDMSKEDKLNSTFPLIFNLLTEMSFIINDNKENKRIENNEVKKDKETVEIELNPDFSFYDNLNGLDNNKTFLDTTLSYLNMNKKDIFFPLKLTNKTPFLFPKIKNLFKEPLKQIKISEDFTSDFESFPHIKFSNIMMEYGIRKLRFQTFFRLDELNDFVVNIAKAKAIFDSTFIRYKNEDLKEEVLEMIKKEILSFTTITTNNKKNDNVDTVSKNNNTALTEDEKLIETMISSRLSERRYYKRMKKFFVKDLADIELKFMVQSGVSLYNSFLELITFVKDNENSLFSDEKKKEIETDLGKIILGSRKDDLYQISSKDNYLMIIDPAGNDRYEYDFKENELINRFNFVIDLKGDDFYTSTNNFGPASTFNGISFFYDETGDDIYKVKKFALGSSVLGFSVFLDRDGNDFYIGEEYNTAASNLGISIFWDHSGYDNYTSGMKSQGFSEVGAMAFLIDDNGNDNYTLMSKQVDVLRYGDHFNSMGQGFSIGNRDHAAGGYAFLIDKKGNDNYLSDIFAQGTAYWFAFGALIDKEGNDTYNSFQYTQGSGVHLAFGTLLDYAGDDSYKAKGVSMGCGHDYASGILLDHSGDDSYIAESLSIGAGNADGFSLFIDYYGNDIYGARKKNTMGYSDWRRDTGYIGIFIDKQGDDKYGAPFGENDTKWFHSTWGVGIDE